MSLLKNKNNRNIIHNVAGSFAFKGATVALNMLSIPLYLNYFGDNEVLGIWFTILNVLNWLLTFDLGIGNGLRNHLTAAIAKNDTAKAKELISSAYIMLGGVMICLTMAFLAISGIIDWNSFFNVSPELLPHAILEKCINITMAGILVSFFLRLVIAINYALQKSALNNLIALMSSLLTYTYLLCASSESYVSNFQKLSIFNAVSVNAPLLVATFMAFSHKSLRGALPSYRHCTSTSARKVFSLGVAFLYIQLLYMVITVTNEWFISKFYNPTYCVDYQIYHKLFSLFGTLFMLALTPLWSAITKAYTEERYMWIIKLQRLLYLLFVIIVILQVLMVPVMPRILDLWLGDKAIDVDYTTVWIFVAFSVVYTWNAVQSVMVSGLGELRLQGYGYTFAALFKVIVIIYFHSVFNWNWVITATILGLLPYSIAQPFFTHRTLKHRLATAKL